jgi:ribosome biogenesis GTPase
LERNNNYNDKLENVRIENNLNDFEIGRVISEHKDRYIVQTEKGEFEATYYKYLKPYSGKHRDEIKKR